MIVKRVALAKVTVRKKIANPKKMHDKLGGSEEVEYILFWEQNGKIFIMNGSVSLI